jgi:hypothetical protein
MSRYQIPVRPEHLATMPNAQAFVGWDNPLQTFYGQVLDPNRPADQPEAVFWIGAVPHAYPDVVAFGLAMAPWAQVPMRVLAALVRDRALATPPTPLQQALSRLTYRDMGPQTCAAAAPMTQDAYRAAGGGQCPACQGGHIEGKRFETESGLVSQTCTCQDCGQVWSAMYRLAGYVREGDAGDQDWEAFATTEIVAPDTATDES